MLITIQIELKALQARPLEAAERSWYELRFFRLVKGYGIIYSMFKAVIFDYGGVIAKGGVAGSVERNLARVLSISQDDARKLLEYNLASFVRGQIDTSLFWKNIETDYGLAIPDESRAIWYEWKDASPLPEMISFRDVLRDSGITTGVLSNTEPVVGDFLRDHGAYAGFDEVVLSYEVGFAKPDKEIYHTMIDKLKLEPGEVIFIDDQPRMLLPAQEIGMHTVHATSSSQIMEEVFQALGRT